MRFAKFIVAALVAGGQFAQSAISDGTITGGEWSGIVAAALASILVLIVPNIDTARDSSHTE